jgi:ABC-type nitrate/sulfonate/bicarbonate transport system substrate-binding protein
MPTRKARVFALRHLGLDADKDVQLLALGTNEVMWSALQTGRVSATRAVTSTSFMAAR